MIMPEKMKSETSGVKLLLSLFVGLALSTSHSVVHAERALGRPTESRLALVVGNQAYAEKPLRNPVNDARDMKAALENLGFTVIYRENADLAEMDNAIHEFSGRLDRNTVGVFYFSGHGAQADGINYLVPVKASIASKAELKARGYDASIVLGSMEEAGARVSVVILDACRDAPFRSFRSSVGGLAQMMGRGSGSLIAFATAPGETAEDGRGRNGTFTRHLLAHLAEPGLSAIDMLRKVSTEVAEETGDEQRPWVNFGPERQGPFCFGGCSVQTPPTPDPAAFELSFWDSIKASDNPEDFEEYLRQFPRGRFVVPARSALKHLRVAAEVPLPAPPKPEPPPVPSTPAVGPRPTPSTTDFGIEMVRLPGGTFLMGCGPKDSRCMSDAELRHEVVVRAFTIGKTEVTQGQWKAVMGSNPSYFKQCGNDCPVEQLSFEDVQAFIRKLNAKTGRHYRLPTEAEWEYACRANQETRYCGSDDQSEVAWYIPNSGNKTHPVAGKAANGFELYDMSGNVFEWTCSAYTDAYDGSEKRCDNDAGNLRVIRGGSWGWSPPDDVSSAYRLRWAPYYRENHVGFRLAQDLSL